MIVDSFDRIATETIRDHEPGRRRTRAQPPCLPCSVETATQTLHRLTSYQPGREWDEAIDDPRIVQDLEANDMSRLPWFVKRYPEPLPRTPLPRELPVTAEPARPAAQAAAA